MKIFTSWISSNQIPSNFVVDKDGQTERYTTKPPCHVQRTKAEGGIQAGRVRENRSEYCFEEQTKVQHVISDKILELKYYFMYRYLLYIFRIRIENKEYQTFCYHFDCSLQFLLRYFIRLFMLF